MENPPPPPPTKKEEKKYPTEPDKEGFYFESADEENAGMATKKYDNGAAIKKVLLKNGTTAIVRKLKGRDFVESKKLVRNDNGSDFETINMAQAVEIDGKKQPPEYYLDDLFQEDYATLLVAYGELNLS